MSRVAAVVVALAVALGVSGAGYAVDAATDRNAPSSVAGPGLVTIELGIEHSEYSAERIRVHRGTLVRFVVRNADPIPHELIVGGPDVHANHTNGSELVHPPLPGEVSVDPHDSGVTIYRFDEPGTVLYACHLPGHFEYGMQGHVEVID
jgi:uncharacterized cupredoxin-like copper-binding protein